MLLECECGRPAILDDKDRPVCSLCKKSRTACGCFMVNVK